MRFLSLISVGMLGCGMAVSAAQTGPWLIDADANVTVTQNAYSDSWTGSEKGALSWASKANFTAEKQLMAWLNHRNTLKLAYGQTKTQNEDNSWGVFSKSADLIDFETLQRFTLEKWVEPFVAGRLISQFTDEDTDNRHYINPMDITESFGVSRSIVASGSIKWDARFGGAIQQKVDRYFYDIEKGESDLDVVNNSGLELLTEMKASLRSGLMDYKGQLKLFEALVTSASDNAPEDKDGTPYWRYLDVTWDNDLSINLSKYIMVNFTLQMLYDREIHANARIKEVVAVGLMYKFNNAPKTAK